MPEDAYSAVADSQLDSLQTVDPDLYDAVLAACELIFDFPGHAQSTSAAIHTDNGIVFRLPVAGYVDYKVFWSYTDDGPRVEAVFPYPS